MRNNFKFFIKKTIFLILFTLISCKLDRDYLDNSRNEKLQNIETKDHQYCISLGLDFGNDPLKSEIYLRCRIILANHKLISEAITPEAIRHNQDIRNFIASLIEKFNEAYEKVNDFRNDFINNNEHKICEGMGFDINSLDQNNVEKYMTCRRRLIREWNMKPPFKKTEYLNRPADTYNTPLVINKHIDAETEALAKAKEKYPICAMNLNIKSDEFKKCMQDFDNQIICYSNAKKSRFTKEMEERAMCQRKLYIRFPDSMIKKTDREKEQEEITNIKILADFYNNNNFYSIGIDKDLLEKFKAEDKKKPDTKTKEETTKKDFNTKDQLYTKVEITSLRQRFIKGCNDDANPKIEYYFSQLNQGCRASTLKWEK